MPSNHVVPAERTATSSALLANLADAVDRGAKPEVVLRQACRAATVTVPACDHAGVILHRSGAVIVTAASDPVAAKVNEVELAMGARPRLDGAADDVIQIDADLESSSQWPAFAARIVAETPVRGVMTFPLLRGRREVGALKLLTDVANAFDHLSAGRAIMPVAFATVAADAALQVPQVSRLTSASSCK